MGYQDIWVKGKSVEKGKRDCEKRYSAIKEVLEQVDSPVVLDFGGHTGYFSYRIAEDFNCPVYLVTTSKNIEDIHRQNDNPNVHILQGKVNARQLQEYIQKFNVNTVLALSVLHNNASWENLYNVISKVPHLFCETPGPDEKTTIYAQNHASILAKFKGKKTLCKTPCLSRKGHFLRPLFYAYNPTTLKGKYCTFDPATGLKTFKSTIARDKAFEAQSLAFDIDCAPKPIEKVGDLQYRTEVADTTWFMENLRSTVYCQKIFPELNAKIKPIFKKIYGIATADLHKKNLGILRGKVVLVDFSYRDDK